ncbi:MAG: hypothetical protein Ct9H300mP11_28250 [Chloroflexota bacterium]|nr:MAG: hypothetical protein Ct9H300mP11_28250 [Chloroflexota bacterium]
MGGGPHQSCAASDRQIWCMLAHYPANPEFVAGTFHIYGTRSKKAGRHQSEVTVSLKRAYSSPTWVWAKQDTYEAVAL